MSRHRGDEFRTRDQVRVVGQWLPDSCSERFKDGWWTAYNCNESNLNGRYLRGGHTSRGDGVNWYHWTGYYYSLRFTEMKIRPFNA